MSDIVKTQEWYDTSYDNAGFDAQRRYPNEELLRFMGRNYFHLDSQKRNSIKVLEVGCGSCSNLWMIAKEGFDSYGIDLSGKAIDLGNKMLDKWGVKANLEIASMTGLPYLANDFDVVVDVFSSYCLGLIDFEKYLNEANRILKPGGRIFIYTPSINSEAFRNYSPAVKLDDYTLSGIHRKDSPFYGNFYTFRFSDMKQLELILRRINFKIIGFENVSRTYKNGTEYFEFITVEAEKL